MKALISTLEPCETGYRVAQFSDAEFPVADPLFWIRCDELPNDSSSYFYDPTTQTILPVPGPEPATTEESV